MDSQLSKRSGQAITPALPYFKAFVELQQRMWSEEDHGGNIILTVAENKLTTDVLQDKIQQLGRVPASVFYYPPTMKGTPEFRRCVAKVMQRTFLQGLEVDPDHLVISAGCGAILENLFFCLADSGDAVLIPAPYYPAFDNDLKVKCGVIPTPVHFDRSRDLGPQLEMAREAALAAGHRVRALLVSSPDNPTGMAYSEEHLVQMLAWCLAHEVHIVSDEIYALSVFAEGERHLSTLSVAAAEAGRLPHPERLRSLLHLVWGFSKDFCASGMRVGILYSRNPELLKAQDNLSYFVTTSNHTQWIFQELLADEAWTDGYLKENQRRLRRSWELLSGGLREAGIPFQTAVAGMFAWIDLRSLLPEPTWEAERELWTHMAYKHGLLLTPGESCHGAEPGFFRVCWAWMAPEALPHAVARLKAITGERTRKAAT